MKIIRSKIFTVIIAIISLVYLLLYWHPLIISSDETFTLSLIHHTFSRLIYLDSLDVHPPLYYLLLKVFISALTSWTQNVVIKVMVARLFSILATIIMFMYLVKYAKLLGFKFNDIVLWIMFLLLPNVLGIRFLFQQMTNIRMYALAALFTTMSLYYLFKCYYKNPSVTNWSLFTVSSIAAAYTHYYAAMFVGLLILAYLINSIYMHRNKSYIKSLITSLIILIISYIPWIKIFYKQITNTHTYWMTYHIMFRDIIIYVVLFGIFIYPLYRYSQQDANKLFKQQLIIIGIILIIVFILTVGFSIISRPIFLSRYFYPLLIIYEFLGLCSIYQLFKSISFLKINVFAVIAMLFLNGFGSAIYQLRNFDTQNVESKRIESYANSEHSPVRLRCNSKLDLLQNYIYILYKGHHRYFELNGGNIKHPILKVHRKTYLVVTKYILNHR